MNDPRKELISAIVTSVLATAATQITSIVINEAHAFLRNKLSPAPQPDEDESPISDNQEDDEIDEDEDVKKKRTLRKSLTFKDLTVI